MDSKIDVASLTDESRYRLLVESITDYAVYMLDPDGIVTSWNSGAQRFKGYDRSEIIGKHFSRFYRPADRAAGLPEKALRTAAVEGRFEGEGWRIRKDGSLFWTHVVIDPIRDPSGNLIGFAKITRDLTERKTAEMALKRSEEQFRLLIQSVTDYAIYMLDADGRVASWNMGAKRITGYSAEEIIGQHFSLFYTEEERQRGEPQRALEVAAKEGRFEKEGRRLRKDGTHFWANAVLDAIRDDRGELIGFAKITRDITERKEAQQALDEAREALFQVQKMEAVGQITGGVAHDFNNLLMVVLSSLELLKRKLPADQRLISLVDNAAQAAQRGAALTQRMLAFARRQALDQRSIDLVELVQGMRELLQRSLGPSIRIETRFPAALAKVSTDSNQLEAALLNLAVNARDAMPEGGSIFISAYEETLSKGNAGGIQAGRYVCFCVEDQGEGMDEETLARAADPFFTTKGVGKGTGLGLSMVQGLAAQSGGQLILKSRKGHGTRAEIWLPVADGADEPSYVEPDASDEKSPAARQLSVLAVDDDALILMNTAAMLEDLGHSVLEAGSGEAALQLLGNGQKVDLVITDQAMPGMRGDQLVSRIRAEWPELPIILATGYAELPEGVATDVPRLGKPFFQQQLEDAVNEAIRTRGLTQPAARRLRPAS
ncbi:MAG TPA: PAS domain S-box protein [Rhizobiaceae bacterium]|nr:PAS domain S-box protein [Rhizobiaceae bacterium]